MIEPAPFARDGAPFRGRAGTMLAVLAIFAFAMAFQGSRGLWEPDEGRYSHIAYRMIRTGNFIVPSFNEHTPHFAKPPLTYWAVAGGIALLGRNEFGARLAHALAFAGTILIIFFLARKIHPTRPWLPPLIYASSVLPFAAANTVTPDTLLTFCETLAVLGFALAWECRDSRQRRKRLLLMWFGFGLAFLTKGPPGLLPLLAILSFATLVEGKRAVLGLVSVSGLLAFAILGLGWYAVVAATQPGLLRYFLWDEFVQRIASDSTHRNPEWYAGFIVYPPTLIGGMLPWTFALVAAVKFLPRSLLSRGWWRDKLAHDPWPAFLAIWLLLPLAVFWVSRSRLPLYLLPLFVPLSLITAKLLDRWTPRRLSICLLAVWLATLIAVKWGASKYTYALDGRPLAAAIHANVVPAPSEILFIDTRPVWGLGFYLNCDVERVQSSSAPPSPEAKEQTLAAKLDMRTPRTLIVIKKRQRAEVEAILDGLGYQTQSITEVNNWLIIMPWRRAGSGLENRKS